jgi:hypothetical protein
VGQEGAEGGAQDATHTRKVSLSNSSGRVNPGGGGEGEIQFMSRAWKNHGHTYQVAAAKKLGQGHKHHARSHPLTCSSSESFFFATSPISFCLYSCLWSSAAAWGE